MLEIWSALSVPYLTTIQPTGSLTWGLCWICIFLLFEYFINPLSEIWGCLKTWVQHSSHKSSTTHSYHWVQYFCVAKQWYTCQWLRLYLTCAQMLYIWTHTGVCTNTVRQESLYWNLTLRERSLVTLAIKSALVLAWLFFLKFYQLSYPNLWKTKYKSVFVFLSIPLLQWSACCMPWSRGWKSESLRLQNLSNIYIY